jgi:hypothetical protein
MGKHKLLGKSNNAWKKSLNDHIGKFADRLSLDDLLTLGIGVLGGLHTESLEGGMITMVGYKLARANNLPAGLAGVATLTAVGLAGLPLSGEEYARIEPEKPDIECGIGEDLRWSFLGGWQCVKIRP